MQGIVILVVILGRIKRLKLRYFCDDRIGPLFLSQFPGLFRLLFLVFIVPKNGAPVLGANVGSLAIQCRRIMGGEEDLQYG